jgi:hypothetical protein
VPFNADAVQSPVVFMRSGAFSPVHAVKVCNSNIAYHQIKFPATIMCSGLTFVEDGAYQ